MRYHFSVFKVGPKWAAQILDMEQDELLVRFRTFATKAQADTQIKEWKSNPKFNR